MRTTEMVLFAHFLKTSKFIPACISIYILSLYNNLQELRCSPLFISALSRLWILRNDIIQCYPIKIRIITRTFQGYICMANLNQTTSFSIIQQSLNLSSCILL